jgi:hypothetical protein
LPVLALCGLGVAWVFAIVASPYTRRTRRAVVETIEMALREVTVESVGFASGPPSSEPRPAHHG